MWIHENTNLVLHSHAEIRVHASGFFLPQILTDEILASVGYPRVALVTPTYDRVTQSVTELPPALVGGVFTQQWQVNDLTPTQVAENQAKAAKELQDGIVNAAQQRLDDFAKTRNYDGILSATTYVGSTVPRFQLEGTYALHARDDTWAALYTVLEEVASGTRVAPSSYADIEPLLPPLAWPI